MSIAGVLMNYIVAFFAFPIFILALRYVPSFGYFTVVLVNILSLIYTYSLVFLVFNLIPVYPLDGFRVVDVFSKRRSRVYWFLRTQGIYVLYALIALSILSDYTGLYALNIFGNFMSNVTNIIGRPIILFWGLIF